MGKLTRRLGFANAAVAIEMGTGLDDQFGYADIAVDAATGDNFKPGCNDVSVKVSADQYTLGVQVTVNPSVLANRYL